jgi:hypothetical protein
MSKHIKHTPLVRLAATAKMITTDISKIPSGIKEKKETFTKRVQQEVEQRRTTLNMMTD